MPEQVFEKLQLGRESTEGTSVAATKIYPTDPGVIFDLDRGFASPEEDYASLARHQSGRGSYGMRQAGYSAGGVVTFEGIMDLFEMALKGTVTPTGAGADKTWTYTADATSDTLKSYSAEAGDDFKAWLLAGCLISELTIGFDALTTPGEVPWRYSATVIARNRTATTFTGALSAPAIFETVEGHLTTIAEGTTATAFGSLAAVTATLVRYQLLVNNNLVLRGYGGTTDVPSGHGRGRREVTVEAMLKQSTTTTTNIHDIYAASGATVGERRWRIEALGSVIPATAVNKTLRIDHRLGFDSVGIAERDGERTYDVAAHAVYDSTLASDVQCVAISAVTAL